MTKIPSIGRLLTTLLLCIACTGCSKDIVADIANGNASPPKILPNILKLAKHTMTYTVTGLAMCGSNRVAIINNKIYTEGMEIKRGVIIENIQLTYVSILADGQEHLLRPESIQQQMDQKTK